MLRPTMSHAVNKKEFKLLMSQYATYLEMKVEDLEKANLVLKEKINYDSWIINPDRSGGAW
jgi:hypothetical protein